MKNWWIVSSSFMNFEFIYLFIYFFIHVLFFLWKPKHERRPNASGDIKVWICSSWNAFEFRIDNTFIWLIHIILYSLLIQHFYMIFFPLRRAHRNGRKLLNGSTKAVFFYSLIRKMRMRRMKREKKKCLNSTTKYKNRFLFLIRIWMNKYTLIKRAEEKCEKPWTAKK